MKKSLLILFALFIGLNVFGQRQRQRNRDMNRIPQTQREPTDKEIANRKQLMEDRKNEFIANFITTLEADDFQKEIIKQTLNSYFDELVKINKLRLKHYERETQIDQLDKRHFKDVKAMVTEEVMVKIIDAARGEWDTKEDKKKKKKKRKKKKRQQRKDNN